MNEEKIKKLYPFQYYTFKNVSVIKPYLTKYMFKTEHENELYIGNINGLLTMGEMLPIKMLNYFKANRKATFILPENYKETIDGLNGFREQILKIIDFFSKQISIFTYKTDNSDIISKIKETDMTFDVAIMNPPYGKSLPLKIIAEILPHCNKVVNISPCRWLEDPLARYKSNSEYKKFEDKVSKKIEDLIIIEADVANELFDIDHTDLGIYTLGNGGYDYSKLSEMDSITRKIFEKCKGNKTIMDISTIEGYRGPHEGFFGVIGSHRHPDSKFISDDYGLFTAYRETCGNKLIFFDSENERKSGFNYLTSKLLRYYSSKIRTNQRIPWQFVPVIDFKEDCTDSYLKKYFGLTDEEYKNISC